MSSSAPRRRQLDRLPPSDGSRLDSSAASSASSSSALRRFRRRRLPRRCDRISAVAARPLSTLRRFALRPARSWPFACARLRLFERGIVAAIAHRVVGHGCFARHRSSVCSSIVGHETVHAEPTLIVRLPTRHPSRNPSSTKSYAYKQNRRQEEDHQDHDHRGAKQFAPRRPRNLVHLSFDRNQKIGKRRHLHDPKARPQPDSQHHQRNEVLDDIRYVATSRAVAAMPPKYSLKLQAPARRSPPSAANVACRAILPWLRLYKPKRNSS